MTRTFLTAGILLATSTAPALAYIDPITGSIVLQALIGGFAAAMVAIRGVRDRVLGLFGLNKAQASADDRAEG